MAYRCLHDDVPHSRTLGRLTDPAERLYMRILAVTDPWGRVTGDLDKLRLVALPSLPWDDDKLHRAIAELEQAGAIARYLTDGVWVIQVVNFDERQLVAKIKRAASRFPNRTPSSLSANDLTLSLPLPDTGLGACDLGLSNTDLRASAKTRSEKSLQNPRSTREKTEDREDRRESGLPTDEAREPARSLSVSHSLEESLAQADRAHAAGLALVPTSDLAGDGLSVDGFARLPAGEVGPEPGTAEWLLARLRDGDAGTLNVLASLRKKLPAAAFMQAAESLGDRKVRPDKPQLQSDVRYVVNALKTMLREGTYRQEGAAA